MEHTELNGGSARCKQFSLLVCDLKHCVLLCIGTGSYINISINSIYFEKFVFKLKKNVTSKNIANQVGDKETNIILFKIPPYVENWGESNTFTMKNAITLQMFPDLLITSHYL